MIMFDLPHLVDLQIDRLHWAIIRYSMYTMTDLCARKTENFLRWLSIQVCNGKVQDPSEDFARGGPFASSLSQIRKKITKLTVRILYSIKINEGSTMVKNKFKKVMFISCKYY